VGAVATAAIAAFAASAAPIASSPVPGLAAVRNCGSAAPLRRGVAYRYVVLQAWESKLAQAIKRRAPGTKVLVYKDMASTRDDAVRAGQLPAGVGYAYANRRHPDWFLKDTNGRRVAWADWPHAWQMDVGNPSYQQAWAANVAQDVRRQGWDGVFVDGVARTMQYPWYLNGRVLAKYPGADDYARATTSFLQRVGPALRKQHLLVVGNVNDAGMTLWKRWVGYLSGVSKEWWTKAHAGTADGLLSGDDWWFQTRLLAAAEARRKIFIAITYGPPADRASMEYARASFLLFANGRRSAQTFSMGCAGEPASRYWRESVGAPLGAAASDGGIWRRRFTNGIVVVNPSATATVSTPLGGAYLHPDGTLVSSVVLPPHSGLVLRRR
jgi:hypothetical protein